jgi:hypothetical protein
MRRPMNVPCSIALLSLFVASCAPDAPTATAPSAPQLARTAVAYTAADLGSIAGNNTRATGVNDAGDVAIATCCGAGSGAFARVGDVVTSLAGEGTSAQDISNGSTLYVVGFAGAPSQPVRWTVGAGVTTTPLALPAGMTYGAAFGVNDAGDVAGKVGTIDGSDAAVWLAGTPVVVPTPGGMSGGEARAINNTGHAAIVFFANGSSILGARGQLRLPSGALTLLPPDGTDVTSYANDVSDVTDDDKVYVAGTTLATGPYDGRAVRWTVDATTGAILDTQIRSEASHGTSVSDAGGVVGYLESNGDRASARTTAFLWRGTSLLKLAPPKGGKNGTAWSVSPNGASVAGHAIVGCCQHAITWTILVP